MFSQTALYFRALLSGRQIADYCPRVINNYDPNLTKNSCHFKLLEQKCLEYEAHLKFIEEVAFTKETKIEGE